MLTLIYLGDKNVIFQNQHNKTAMIIQGIEA